MLNTEQANALEAMVDATSLYEVVDALAEVCQGKAMHLEANWQDERLAALWAKAGDQLEHLLPKVRHVGLARWGHA